MNERIKQLRKALNLTMEKFGMQLGVKKNTVSQWESGINSLTDQMLKSICNTNWDGRYVNEEWLRTGAGGNNNMFTPEPTTVLDELASKYDLTNRDYVFIEKLLKHKELLSALEDFCLNYSQSMNEKDEKPFPIPTRLISYYYKNASAGTGQIIIDNLPGDHIEIPDIPEYKSVSYAIGVNGSSMEPTYHDGDILLVETTQEILTGDIGIFQVKDECYVKKLGEMELISLNAAYDNIPLDESTRTMGKVIDKLEKGEP